MKTFVKSILSLSIGSVIALSTANAATYSVQVISEVDTHSSTFGQFQNNQDDDEFTISATNSFDFPVVVQDLFDDLGLFQNPLGELQFGLNGNVFEDSDAFINGTPTANDLEIAVDFLQSQSDLTFQQVGDQSVFVDFGSGPNLITIWDEEFTDPSFSSFGQLTRSTEDFISGISSEGWLYGSGSAPHLPQTAEDGTRYWLSEFDLKAYVSIDDGNSAIEVNAPEITYGGQSALLDMKEVNGVQTGVGFASVALVESVQNIIQDEESGCEAISADDVEEALCIESLRSGLYQIRAYQWFFDTVGNPDAGESLGLLITPNEDDTRSHESYALAVNDNGEVAGYSTGFFLDTDNEPVLAPAADEPVSTYAVVFRDGEVIDLTDDHSEFFASRANDINNSGVAVGFVTSSIQGVQRTSFFHVDINRDNIEMVLPDGFFTSSSSVARAINNGNVIVGDAEIEQNVGSSTDPRRRNAFFYDIAEDEFENINDFLSCPEQDKYEIIEARDINDNNEITGTALVEVERRDALGEVVVDENGDPLFEFVQQAVRLTPVNGEIEDCDAINDVLIEREGASMSWLFLLFTGLIFIRRKF